MLLSLIITWEKKIRPYAFKNGASFSTVCTTQSAYISLRIKSVLASNSSKKRNNKNNNEMKQDQKKTMYDISHGI